MGKHLFDEEYFQKRGDLFPEVKAFFFSLTLSLFLMPKTLLDVGCARGEFVKWMQRFGIKGEGIDVSPEAISVARESHHLNCRVGSILKLPYPENKFDLVTSFAVLEHIDEKDLHQALGEVRRVSKRYIFHQICVKDNPFEKNQHYLLDPTHVTIKNSSWWRKKFNNLNLKVVFSIPQLGFFLIRK